MIIDEVKNRIFYLSFSMVDKVNPESFKTGETVSVTGYYKDGAGSWTSLTGLNSVTEIGNGLYALTLSAANLSHDLVDLVFTAANSATTLILFKLNDLSVPGKTLYIDPTNGDNANNGLDRQHAKKYIVTETGGNSALTDANDGDTLHLIGVSNENVDTASWVGTIRGDHFRSSQISVSSGAALTVGDYVRAHDISCKSTHQASGGYGLDCSSQEGVILERVDLQGGFDGLFATGSKRLRVIDSLCTGEYDGGNLTNAQGYIITGTRFKSLGTYTGVDCRGVTASGTGIFAFCSFRADIVAATAYRAGGVHLGAGARVSLFGCSLESSAGASNTGDPYGILCASGTAYESSAAFCPFRVATSGSGTAYDIIITSGNVRPTGCVSGSSYSGEVGDGEMAAGAPPATASIEEKINYLYTLFRNKSLQTDVLLTVRNNADDADLFKATVSDNGTTFTKEEFVSG